MTRAPEYDETKPGNTRKDGEEPEIPSTQASQGRTLGIQRYVLFTAVGLVILGFIVSYFMVVS